MAGKRLAAGQQDGPIPKKKRVKSPCLLCPADNKKESYYGMVNEKGKWNYQCCNSHYKELVTKGEDVTKLITRAKAIELKSGKPPKSCRHGACTTTAYWGVWDAEKKLFSPKLCTLHYEMAMSGSEVASEPLESLEHYVSDTQAVLLRTGKVLKQCTEEGCTTQSSYGPPCSRFTATHCQLHSDPTTMVSVKQNLRMYHPEKAAAAAKKNQQLFRQHIKCPGTPDGEPCTHGGSKTYTSELRCAFCADGVTADQLQGRPGHRKYEAIALEVVEEELKKLDVNPYVVKEEVNMINYGFDNFKATTASSRRDIVIADAAAAEVLVSISNAINGYMSSKDKPAAPLHMQNFNNQAVGILEIDEKAHAAYDMGNEVCRIMSAMDLSEESIVTLVKVAPDPNRNQDPVGWPISPRERLCVAIELLFATMEKATKDNVTYLFYPPRSKHLVIARETLVPRTDIDVSLNPELHSTKSKATLKSFFS